MALNIFGYGIKFFKSLILFFAGSFILGTRRGGVNITTSGDSCKPPTDEYSDLEYCAINRFNFAVQAGGD